MDSRSEHQLKFKKFDGKDFSLWKAKVENGLMFLGIDGSLTVKNESTEVAKTLIDKKALSFVKDALSDNLFRKYAQTTTKELWDKLKEDYETVDAQLLFVKRNKFLFCKKSRSESMVEYLNRLTSLKQELTEAGNAVNDPDFILTIMNGTHEEYGDYVSAISGKETIDKLKVDEFMKKLIQEDALRTSMNQKSGSNDKRVMYTKHKYNGKEGKDGSKTKSLKKSRKCYSCGTPGHYASECRKPKSEAKSVSFQKPSNQKEKEYVCIERDGTKQRICTISDVNFTTKNESNERSKWLLDSGASTHVCNSPSMFEDIEPAYSSIIVGDDREVAVTGRGTVKLKVVADNKTNILRLNDVALVPDLGVNLVSTGRLESQGLKITTENGMSQISLNKELIGRAIRTADNPYLYEFVKPSSDSVLVTKSINSTADWSVWHQRLGHLSGVYMSKLNPTDIKISSNEEFCEQCHLCKAKKLPHKCKPQDKIDEERLSGLRKGVIHSDLMGPMKTKSLSGCRYVLTYICSHTEFSYVYLLKSKSEQSYYFKEFKALYENQTGSKVRELRSDNGLEYFSNDFQGYLKAEGIRHLTSVAYVPQSNGKAERLNLTLLDKARTMMLTAKLDTFMWGSAILTANYLRNRSPCKPINFKTPYELVYGKAPGLAHLKIFGCKAFPLIVNKDRNKFDPTAQQNCVMTGYDDRDGIYWIYNKSKRSIFRSRDVKFNEQMNLKETDESLDNSETNEWFEITLDNEVDSESNAEEVVQEEESQGLDETDENEEVSEGTVEMLGQTEAISEETVEMPGQFEAISEETVEMPVQIEAENEDFLTTPGASNSVTIRKSTRSTKPIDRLVVRPDSKTYIINEETLSDPKTIKEALKRSDSKKWIEAIKSELDSIAENEVWDVVDRPSDKAVIGTKWVFKIKRNAENIPEKYKARLVAKGYNQEYGIDYYETFSPVVKVQTLRTIFAIAANHGLSVHQVDINTAFLNGYLDEEIYVENPPGCDSFNKQKVCRLKKSLYGLKQAPRAWNTTLVKFLSGYGLKQLSADVCVFTNNHLIVAIYVDDIIIAGKDEKEIIDFKDKISKRFKTKDLGKANYVLKIKVEQIRGGGWKMHQQNYIDDIIKLYELNNDKNVELPIQPSHGLTLELNDEKEPLRELVDSTKYRQAIGKLMYLMVCTRPDISYAVSVLSRFMSQPRMKHWRFVRQLLKYVKFTRDYALFYPSCGSTILTGYSDSDHAGDLGDRKSTSGYIFILSGCTISWKSTKQCTVAISSTEAEYIALSQATQEAIWLKELLAQLGFPQDQITMCGDNLSSMQIVKNASTHNRSKHIDVRYHFIRDHYQKGTIGLQYIESESLCADLLTKGVNKVMHYKCMKLINLVN